MVKLDNYVFLTICEKSYELFKKSNFMTYAAYCNNIGISFKIGRDHFSRNELSDITDMVLFVNKIYNFSSNESLKYVENFFVLKKHLVFEYISRITLQQYNNCYN